jgi:hypothetical protein
MMKGGEGVEYTPHARFFLSLAVARTIVAFIEASLAWSDAISSYHSSAISYDFQRHVAVDMLRTHVFLRHLSAEGAQLGWEVGVSSSSSPGTRPKVQPGALTTICTGSGWS